MIIYAMDDKYDKHVCNNKQNIVTSTIGLVFLIARIDVPHPRHTTSEPCEHVFGNARRYKREDIVQEFVEIVEKLEK